MPQPPPAHYYPIALDLKGKPCLVVGGGLIADGKLDALLAGGAEVTVVAPEVRPRIAALAAAGRLALHRRPYQPGDAAGAFLVIGATDDRAANARVAADGRAAGALVNAVDDIPNCDFFAVAIVRRGDLQVAISTNGRSPAFARWLREHLDASLPAEYADLLALLGDVRDRLKADGTLLPYEAWQPTITDDLLRDLRAGRHEAAATRVYDHLATGIDPREHAP